MRQVTKQGLISVAAAAGGVLAMSGGPAFADSNAGGSTARSSGVLSGNNVQVPVHIPVNACGNSVNVGGALNPATGNRCANGGDGRGGAGARAEGSAKGSPGVASGNQVQAPVSAPVNACGNSVDVVGAGNPAAGNGCRNGTAGLPRTVPAPRSDASRAATPEHGPSSGQERAGRTGALKPGSGAVDPAGTAGAVDPAGSSGPGRKAAVPEQSQAPDRRVVDPAEQQGRLAQTGGGSALTTMVPVSAGLLLGGAVLYRRSRGARRG